MFGQEPSKYRRTGMANLSELVAELNTAKRLTKVAGGKRSATTCLRDVRTIDPEGITENSWT